MCEKVDDTLRELKSGALSPELQVHIESCPECRDALLIQRFMQAAAAEGDDEVPAPTAGAIWWRAEIARKRRIAERSVAAIRAVQKIALAVAVLIVLLAATFWGRAIAHDFALPASWLLASLAVVVVSVIGLVFAWAIDRR
ncbi:MAG: hypothetical protein JO061_16955 [Acidobacteriaceae bacterium]|nr:hypothetical protein [Acidobacteriaceae bacterium]